MTTKTMLGLIILAVGLSTIPAFAEIDTPYQQFSNGTPINQIQCTDSKILMESPRNTPACVNESSVEKLENKGFILVDVVTITELETTPADSIIPTSDNSINYDAELMSILEKDLVFTNKETNPNVISELGHRNGINWPIYKVTYPSTAQVGVPFDVIYDYSFVIPDEETGSYVNNNEQCSENRCGKIFFSAKVSDFVSVTSDNLEYFSSRMDVSMNIFRNFTAYTYHPEFDNTQPLQETFTFVINEPDIDYRIGEINVSIKQNKKDLVYFYVGEDGNIIFDPMMKKETFENSSLAKSTAPSVMNTASVIQTELDKLQERTFHQRDITIVQAPVGLRDGVPPELYGYMSEKLLREYPDVNYEEFLQFHNFTQSWIDDFLNAMPHLKPDDSFGLNPIISKEKPIIQQLLNPVITEDIIPQDVTFDYILQMPPDDPDIFAQKMVGLFNDTITKTNHNDMNYMYITERGWIEIMKHPNFFGYEATDFKYTFFGPGRINPSHAEPIKTMLLEELGIVLDGTEYHSEGSPFSYYTFKIIQTKDDLLVKSNTLITIFEPGYTFIKFSNWNDNLSDMNLYDLDKSIQNGRDYALTFETLTKDECDISVRDNMDGVTLFILHGRPVYDIYAGTCQVEYMDGHNEWFSVFVDAITGDPLFIKNRSTF